MSIAILLAAMVTMTPDYAGVAVPPNIAPLNFDLSRAARVTLTGPNGKTLNANGREIRFARNEWRDFLSTCRGRDYVITVESDDGSAPLVATNAVSADAIDGYLTYRLIPPSYGAFGEVGIYQRELSTFDEKPIYRNLQLSRAQCVVRLSQSRRNGGIRPYSTRLRQTRPHAAEVCNGL